MNEFYEISFFILRVVPSLFAFFSSITFLTNRLHRSFPSQTYLITRAQAISRHEQLWQARPSRCTAFAEYRTHAYRQWGVKTERASQRLPKRATSESCEHPIRRSFHLSVSSVPRITPFLSVSSVFGRCFPTFDNLLQALLPFKERLP